MQKIKSDYGLDVEGELAAFQEKNKYCIIDKGTHAKRVLLYLHSGTGYAGINEVVVKFFHDQGFATIAFDAFKMNNVHRPECYSLLVRQKMILKIAQGALRWIGQDIDLHQAELFVYGLSVGGRVALYLSGEQECATARMVIADCPGHIGLLLPDRVLVKTKLLWGTDDTHPPPRTDLLFKRPGILERPSLEKWSQGQPDVETKDYCSDHCIFGTVSAAQQAKQDILGWVNSA